MLTGCLYVPLVVSSVCAYLCRCGSCLGLGYLVMIVLPVTVVNSHPFPFFPSLLPCPSLLHSSFPHPSFLSPSLPLSLHLPSSSLLALPSPSHPPRNTALHMAAWRNRSDIVHMLIVNGARVRPLSNTIDYSTTLTLITWDKTTATVLGIATYTQCTCTCTCTLGCIVVRMYMYMYMYCTCM